MMVKAVKYIDYDLDVRVSRDGTQKLLDEDEYLKHQVKGIVTRKKLKIIESELQVLIEKINKHEQPFDETI